jgi:hypothetical protein
MNLRSRTIALLRISQVEESGSVPQGEKNQAAQMIEWIQYAVAWTLIETLGVLPRMARAMAVGVRMLFALPKLKDGGI